MLSIKDIQKLKHEKTLVETYIEPYLFPIEYTEGGSKKTFYIHGHGQEPIKNGELFRAIINGKAIRL